MRQTNDDAIRELESLVSSIHEERRARSRSKRRVRSTLFVGGLLAAMAVPAIGFSYGPLPQFAPDEPLSAIKMNDTFDTLLVAANDLDTRLSAIEALDIDTRVATLEAAPADQVMVAYDVSSDVSIPSAGVVDYGRELIDTHNSVAVGADWTWTVPVSGTYWVSASSSYDESTGVTVQTQIYINDVFTHAGTDDAAPGVSSSYGHALATHLIQLTAGDTVQVRSAHNSGSSVSLFNGASMCAFYAVRLGP